EVERARPADVMHAEMGQFLLEFRIRLRLVPLPLQVENEGHQRFRNKAATENAETAILVGSGAVGIRYRLVHSLLLRPEQVRLLHRLPQWHQKTHRSFQRPSRPAHSPLRRRHRRRAPWWM